LIASALFICLPAHAQQPEYTAGIHSTTIPTNLTAGTPLQQTTRKGLGDDDTRGRLMPIAGRPATKTGGSPSEEGDASPVNRVWNKYKELATGTAPKEESDPKAVPVPEVKKPDAPNVAAAQEQASPKPSGMQTLLQQYQDNKDTRRQMKSLTFETPKLDNQTSSE